MGLIMLVASYDNFLKYNHDKDIYVYTKETAFVSKGFVYPEGDEFKIFSPLHVNLRHCNILSMRVDGCVISCVGNFNIRLEDFYTYKTDNDTYFAFVGKSDYIILTTDNNFNYLDLEVEEVLKLFATPEERNLHKRIDDLEETVEALKKRISALERGSIFVPQTPPQITSPVDWTPKPNPYIIRNSNRSNG